MGTIGGFVRVARRLYHQSPAFFPATDESILGASGVVPESWRVFAQPGDVDDALCLSAIFAGRQTVVDRRLGAAGHGAARQSEIRAGELCGSGGYAGFGLA